jgi:NodT family efflux transporter outer membrane factor (OMF) lipoprotein
MNTPSASRAAALMVLSAVGGCTVGPTYHQPSTTSPDAYHEMTPADYASTDGWKVAQPTDDRIHGKWWEIFDDPQLDSLEEQVDVSNQNIAAAFAGLQESRAEVREAQAQYWPTLTTSPAVTRSRTPAGVSGATTTLATGTTTSATTAAGTATGSRSGILTTDYSFPFDASWTPDLWGRVRNTVRSNSAAAQASAADLENTRLTAQAQLAVNYYELRAQDSLKQILEATVEADQQSLDLTRALFETGIDNDESVAQADVQLKTAQAQATNLGIMRAQLEHAIALLIGQPASKFSLPVATLQAQPPAVPFGVPSQLLERRPDVAANERLVAQANAQIGIAQAAYYPTLTLSATAGFESSVFSDWFEWPSRFWSVGPALAETLFDGGLRRATVAQYRAAYDQTVATYRQTVLTAFQQVEDNLASLRILSQEVRQQDAAVAASQRLLTIATDRYRLGLDPYLDVITAQSTLLTNQQTDVTLHLDQITATVQLIEALGGGWDRSELPTP